MNKPGQKTAMISSTSIDLPAHREQAIDACLRQDVFPIAMEHLPASDADAIRVSLEMVDKADIYIGVYGWRYGHVPQGHAISITEMEFNRAVERGIPILVFLMHEKHPLESRNMVEADAAAQQKLEALKKRASTGRGRLEFQSPVEVRSHIIQSLSALLPQLAAAAGETKTPDFHPPNIIPKLPEPYVAHPYSLLQTKDVVGRQVELNLLTDWVTTNKLVPADTRIFNLVAIGGMGKSALTWKWFNDIAPNELPKLAGRMWWSFYESDAHWENFVIRALAYVSGLSEKEVREMKSPEREDQLWQILDQQPFLLVLDGLERILLAYARMDAAQMLDDDLDQKTAHEERMFAGVPESIHETYLQKHRLRKCIDSNAGRFLRRLTTIRASRILVSTRLYPAELQTNTAQPWPACFVGFLKGLSDDDAINLWREFGVTGSRDQLLKIFNAFGNYPLLIRALAGEIAEYKPSPGNFDHWIADNPNFNPSKLDLRNAKTHVLEFSLQGLTEAQRGVLHTLAAFRMPATWTTLRALLVETASEHSSITAPPSSKNRSSVTERIPNRACLEDRELDVVLTELEDRGLVGWDKAANRYDLHPVVRAVAWDMLDSTKKHAVFSAMQNYFAAIPRDPDRIMSFEDLTPSVEHFSSLIGLNHYDEAFNVFSEEIYEEAHIKMGRSRECAEMLEMFHPAGKGNFPPLKGLSRELLALYRASTLQALGEPRIARSILRSDFARTEELRDENLWMAYFDPLPWSIDLYENERAGLIQIARESRRSLKGNAECRCFEISAWESFGLMRALRGTEHGSRITLTRALSVASAQAFHHHAHTKSMACANFGQALLWLGRIELAKDLSNQAWVAARDTRFEREFCRSARLQGQIALKLGNLVEADERLNQALGHARTINFTVEELLTVTALARLNQCHKQYDAARELLDQVWDVAKRGPYPLFHADALNVLAQIERDEGNKEAAIAAATKAYTLAWCDGPPYAYHYGLTNARKHLKELGAPEPQLPPFDESKFEPMPDVELNPKDEFWVDPEKLDSLSEE